MVAARRAPFWTYDPVARAAYLRFSDALVLVTREISEAVLVDLDADAKIVGIEILNVETDPTTRRAHDGRGAVIDDTVDGWTNGSAEPLQKIRPIIGPVNPMPCSNDACPGLTVLGGDDDPDLMTVLELYRGCVIRVTIELVEGPRP